MEKENKWLVALPVVKAAVLAAARALVRGSGLLAVALAALLAGLEALGVPALKLFASLCNSPPLPPLP